MRRAAVVVAGRYTVVSRAAGGTMVSDVAGDTVMSGAAGGTVVSYAAGGTVVCGRQVEVPWYPGWQEEVP